MKTRTKVALFAIGAVGGALAVKYGKQFISTLKSSIDRKPIEELAKEIRESVIKSADELKKSVEDLCNEVEKSCAENKEFEDIEKIFMERDANKGSVNYVTVPVKSDSKVKTIPIEDEKGFNDSEAKSIKDTNDSDNSNVGETNKEAKYNGNKADLSDLRKYINSLDNEFFNNRFNRNISDREMFNRSNLNRGISNRDMFTGNSKDELQDFITNEKTYMIDKIEDTENKEETKEIIEENSIEEISSDTDTNTDTNKGNNDK